MSSCAPSPSCAAKRSRTCRTSACSRACVPRSSSAMPPVDPPVQLPAQLASTAHVFAERLDDDITVDGDDGHHLQRARRVRAGETITVADGYGRWRAYRVERAAAGEVELAATTQVAHEPELTPRVTIACALTKGQK